MNYQEAVNAVLRACSEAESADIVAAVAGTTEAKFREFFNEAYRTVNTFKRWPWARATTAVTSLGGGGFQLAPTVLETIAVTYNSVLLSEQYSYEDLLYLRSGMQAPLVGQPQFMASPTYGQIYLFPEPTDPLPETLISVLAYVAIPDPTVNADLLAGPAQYHDAVVQKAYAIAQDKHFGDAAAAKAAHQRADQLIQRVATKSRIYKSRPRIRV